MRKENGGKIILLESMVRRGTQKCVLANQPLDRTKEFHSFLFDIEELPASGSVIALGLCAKPYPTFRLPGWHRESFGVHSDDGAKFFDNSFGGVDYCQPFKRGDRISVNYVRSTGKIFLSLNGTKLPDAYEHKFHRLERFPVYLCVGFDGPSKVRLTLDADINSDDDEKSRDLKK
jgi:hypothetical protein